LREGSTFLSAEAKGANNIRMDPVEEQFEPELKPAYFDPDAADMSEQQFAASLEVEIEKSAFVVDNAEGPTVSERISSSSPHVQSPAEPRGDSRSRLSDGAELDEPASEPGNPDPAPDWRDQVSAKVNKYKSSKAPKVRYPSLQLQFDPPPPRRRWEMDFEPDLPAETGARDLEVPVARQVPPPSVSLEATARILEFPRATTPSPMQDELAEPVLDRPRIVEAPALLPPPPALGGILIEEAVEREPERRPGFDMPLQSAPLSRRLLAGTIDTLCVAAALAAFGYVLVRFNGPIQQLRLTVQISATLVAILWPAYQYAFLVFTGTTPGLRLAHLDVTHFDGTPLSRNLRRWRVLASLLSCVSLGLGYAWCFLDEDQLSWHDRITRTHLAPAMRAQ
jgi:uncharacterized RDD family membrane protein YckC